MVDPGHPLSELVGHVSAESRVLLVDDDEDAVRTLERILRKAGFRHVRSLTDSRLVLPELRSFGPDILLLDLRMPHLDGFVVLRQVRRRVPKEEFFPVLVISGESEPEWKQQALLEGASDFLSKPYDAVEVVLRLRNLLDARRLSLRWEERVRKQTEEIRDLQYAVVERLAMLAELRDYQGGPHTKRVGHMAGEIARKLDLPEDEAAVIGRAAQLHDIGKLAVPDAILLKPGALTLEEMDVVKSHTTVGARVLSGSTSPVLQVGEEIALYHHEAWDGTGYTPGLEGEMIPLPARITAVADVFDALRHQRSYKRAWTLEESVDRIAELQGTKFDPAVVEAFLQVVRLHDLPRLDDIYGLEDLARPFQRFHGPDAPPPA